MVTDLQKFISVLWEPDDLVEIRCFDPDRGPRVETDWVFAEDLPDIAQTLQKWNDQGLGIYAGILPRASQGGRDDEDCLPGRVAWVDLDGGTTPREALQRVRKAGLPLPTLVVHSGNGSHLYWRLSRPYPPGRLSVLVYNLAVTLEGDGAVFNPSRVFRVPGFLNTKDPDDWKPCRVVRFWPENVVRYQDLVDKAGSRPIRRHHGEEIPKWTQESPDRKESLRTAGKYVDAVPGLGEGEGRNNKAHYLAKRLRDRGLEKEEVFQVLRTVWNPKNRPPLDDGELWDAVKNGFRYARRDAGSEPFEDRQEDDEERKRLRGRKRKKSTREPQEAQETPSSSIMEKMERRIAEKYDRKRANIQIPQWPILCRNARLLKGGTYSLLAGEPGSSKSLLVLELGRVLDAQGLPWVYLPLEMTQEEHIERYVSALDESFELMDDYEGNARRDRAILRRHQEEIERLADHILPNPDRDGESGMDHEDLRDWLEEVCPKNRLVAIDPMGYINFPSGYAGIEEQDKLAGFLSHIARRHGTSILLVAHTVKAPGRDLSLGDVEGSKRLSGKADAVVLLKSHRKKEAGFEDLDGEDMGRHDYNRVAFLGKGRNARESYLKIGMMFGEYGPNFREVGLLASGKK